ncbi:MAG: efflux RND transporter permease subunit [Deltaproteobacteria bacterium]|nr:efflux RND transporter permease subunit [Deltaproteobacteria bacterium]
MSIAEFSIKKSVITWVMTVVMLVLGYFAYQGLPRLEDPEFAIKEAVILTPYPGASPTEVQEEVTEVIEKAVQEMGQLKRVESYSSRGMSLVHVYIKDKYRKNDLPQVWDELRRRMGDNEKHLPPGAGPITVNDAFGDVFGVYFALEGEGYTYPELKEVAELLQRELLVVQDVKKIELFGLRPEAIYVEMSRIKMAALGITQQEIFNALRAKNLPVDSGRIKFATQYLAFNPTGEFKSEKDFGNLFIASKEGRLIYLRDVATIKRGFVEPPTKILRVNGRESIGIAISTVLGGNAVTMGNAVLKRLDQLQGQIPVGMELVEIAMQSKSVTKAVNGFVINLLESVAIVIVVLAIFMGLRAGILIGFILMLTIAATFVVMGYYHITLERISLGALIIALGMLVDNAIVVVDGMKVKMKNGMDGLQAANEVVGQNALPLLAATAVAIMAFASIGGMSNSTGEYCQSLYYVILISLSLSWIAAVTTTPLVTKQFILSKKDKAGEAKEAYSGKFYQLYRKFLGTAIRFRWITIGIVLGLFIASVFGFGFVKQLFFPASTRPQFMVECFFREGIHVEETAREVKKIEDYLVKQKGVTQVASAIGGGHPRFLLTYGVPVEAANQYSSILVSVDDYRKIDAMQPKFQRDLETMFPDACINVKKFVLGPANGGKLQLRINGDNPEVLRAMAEKAIQIFREEGAKAVRTEWGEKVKVPVPVLAEDRAMALGITRPMVAQAIQANYSGTTTGVYREGINLIPIIARAPAAERDSIQDLNEIQIYSPMARKYIPILQVLNGLETGWENARVSRWHRRQMIKIHADPRRELPAELMARVKPRIEQALGVDLAAYRGKPLEKDEEWTAGTIPIKYDDILPLKSHPGYFIAWGGELEDSSDSQKQLAANIPIYFGMMVLIVIFMFNAFRQPLIIWLTVPLALIGVTAGLLLLKQPFGFMALLGLMSLSGMLIKNAIVLIDQIDINIRSGLPPLQAIIDSGVSRMQPVMMAALTTMMGMIPLFQDAFFVSMAVTIVFGLGFATVLTLLFVPVLYATFFKIR